MNQQAEDSITQMLNCFPQTNQDYAVFLQTLGALLAGLSNEAIIEAARRFASGDVTDQSMRFAPSSAEFIDEVRRRQEFIGVRNRPRLPAPPTYRKGPLAPFEIKRQKALNEYADRTVLFEDISYDQWRRLSAEKAVPAGAIWVASLGIIYGPKPVSQAKAA